MADAVQRGSWGISNESPHSGAWQLLLLPAVLAWRTPVLGNAGLNLQYFLIPVAALLAARFGLTGVIAVAIGGLAFVVDIRGSGWGGIGGNPSLYLIALAVAAIAASRHEPISWPRWPYTARSVAAVTFAAPALLVLSLYVGYSQSPAGGVALAFAFVPSVLCHFLIFMLAARGAQLRHLLAGLAVVALVSWFLAYAGLFPSERSNFMLDMLPLQPVAALTALVFFSAGATFSRGTERPVAWGWWRWPYWSAVVLLLIWLGPLGAIGEIRLDWSRLSVNFFRSAALLPLVAFMLGALRGNRGVWIATGITAALVIAGALGRAASFPYFSTWLIQIEAPFLAYAYGRLGAYLTHPELRGTTKPRRRGRVLSAWLLAIATTLAIAGEGGAARMTLGVVFAVVFCVAYFFGRRIVRATAGSDRELTPEGWLSFLVVVCVALLVALNVGDVTQEVKKQLAGIAFLLASLYSLLQDAVQSGPPTARHSADGLALVYAGAVLIALLLVVSACRKAWKDLRKVWRDIRIAYAYARLVLSSRKSEKRETPG